MENDEQAELDQAAFYLLEKNYRAAGHVLEQIVARGNKSYTTFAAHLSLAEMHQQGWGFPINEEKFLFHLKEPAKNLFLLDPESPICLRNKKLLMNYVIYYQHYFAREIKIIHSFSNTNNTFPFEKMAQITTTLDKFYLSLPIENVKDYLHLLSDFKKTSEAAEIYNSAIDIVQMNIKAIKNVKIPEKTIATKFYKIIIISLLVAEHFNLTFAKDMLCQIRNGKKFGGFDAGQRKALKEILNLAEKKALKKPPVTIPNNSSPKKNKSQKNRTAKPQAPIIAARDDAPNENNIAEAHKVQTIIESKTEIEKPTVISVLPDQVSDQVNTALTEANPVFNNRIPKKKGRIKNLIKNPWSMKEKKSTIKTKNHRPLVGDITDTPSLSEEYGSFESCSHLSCSETECSEGYMEKIIEEKKRLATTEEQEIIVQMEALYPQLFGVLARSEAKNVRDIKISGNLIRATIISMHNNDLIEVTKMNKAIISANQKLNNNNKCLIHCSHPANWNENKNIVAHFFKFIGTSDSVIGKYLHVYFGADCLEPEVYKINNSYILSDHEADESAP